MEEIKLPYTVGLLVWNELEKKNINNKSETINEQLINIDEINK